MADVKISELTLAAAAGDSVVPASNAAGNATNKVTLQSIANLATPASIGAATQSDIDSSISMKVNSNASAVANSSQITNMVSMTQADYDALGSTSNTTLYVIQG
jgi:hypothetical protein